MTSTSTTVVSCAVETIDATARSARTLRRRDIGSTVPRSADSATSAAATGALDRLLAAARTSSRRIRPPTPVPATVERFTPVSVASFLTNGVT